jgi:uncharacterized iron-regulated membrane protein
LRTPTPAQRVHRWHTYLIVWAVHRVLGLGFGALILLASVTGGLLVMHHEIERVVEADRHVIQSSGTATSPLPITTLVRNVAAFAPDGYRPFRLMPGDSRDESHQIMFVASNGRTRWSAFVNPYSGEVLWHGADQSLFTPWVLALHMHLHVGGWGYVVTGLAGVGLFLLGLTGLYLYRDRLGALWRRPLRLNRGRRVAFSDFHKWLGVVSIYFSLILGLTGTIYCITIAPGQIAAAKPLAAPFEFSKLAAVEPMLEFARTRFPGAELRRVAFPTTAKAAVTLLILERDAPVWRKFSRIEFEPATGAVRAVRDAREATPREKFSAMLAPLHMGFYGSPLVKWLYVVGGFAPAILALTGASIWWLRTRSTRNRGASAPAVAHANPATVA